MSLRARLCGIGPTGKACGDCRHLIRNGHLSCSRIKAEQMAAGVKRIDAHVTADLAACAGFEPRLYPLPAPAVESVRAYA